MSHIPVPSHMQLSGDNCNSVPFSWRIKDYVEELGVQAQYISEPAGAPQDVVRGPGWGAATGGHSPPERGSGAAVMRDSGGVLRWSFLNHCPRREQSAFVRADCPCPS